MGSEQSSETAAGNEQDQQDAAVMAALAKLDGQTWRKPPIEAEGTGALAGSTSTEQRKLGEQLHEPPKKTVAAGQGDDGWERHVPGVEDQTDGACDWLST